MSGTIETLTSKVKTDSNSPETVTTRKPPGVAADPHKVLQAAGPSPADNPDGSRPVDLAGDMTQLSTEERESRRHTLRSMLNASEARQQGAQRARRPTFAIGEKLSVVSGEHKGARGITLDADFISNRVQLQLEGLDDPQWVEFGRLVAAAAEE